jgi:hypothetical protein
MLHVDVAWRQHRLTSPAIALVAVPLTSGYSRKKRSAMAKKTGSRKDQKKKHAGTARGGKMNQHRPKGRRSIGSSKPGGDGPGTKKWTKE